VVTSITVVSFVTVLISNLELIQKDKKETLRTANRQVSDLVSRFVLTQVSSYQRGLNYVYEAWRKNPEMKVEAEYFPNYVWFQLIDWQGNAVFEWEDTDKLAQAKMSSYKLLGKRNRDSLFSEVKQVFSKSNEWLLFNSTVDPFLPTFLLATPLGDEDAGGRFVALAEIYAEPLFDQIQSRSGQELMLIDSHQNILFSTKEGWDPSKIILEDPYMLDMVKKLDFGEERLETIEASKTKQAQIASFHKFREGHGLSLVLQEPASTLAEGLHKIQILSAIVAFIVLILAINLIFLFAHKITSPLKKLTDLMQKVGRGEFSGRIVVKSKDEIGQLAKVFNKMLHDLNEREEEVTRAKQKLIQSEKMSAFGQMSAGIAHEVKNPLAGILGYAQMAKKKLEDRPELLSYMEIIEKETTRCKEIVENLMRFARQEKANLQAMDINKAVQDSVRLVEHQITVSGIKIVQMYAKEGKPVKVAGNANQIQQVMLNMMLNAQHAMESKGTLTVSTHLDEASRRVMIMISDTGKGIPPDVQARIFEPFFTTKGVGKGTGLGLSVSLGIIKDHKGTTFTITLPLAQEKKEEEGEEKEVEKKAPKKEQAKAGAA
jgi:signal transduction histidine kinase